MPKKTTSPFSLRLSHEERQELTLRAGNMAVGTYIRACLFQNKIPANSRISKIDTKALAAILAKLGQSNMSANLKDMAQLAHSGSLPLSPATITKLETACQDIASIKTSLMKALRIKEQ